MNISAKYLKVIYAIFFVLLGISLSMGIIDFTYILFKNWGGVIPYWLVWLAVIRDAWLYPFYLVSSLVPITVVIILSRDNLQELNIDKFSVLIIIFSGLAISWSYFWPIGWLTGIAVIFVFYFLFKGKLKFGNANPVLLQMILYIVVGFCGCILLLVRHTISASLLGFTINWLTVDGIPPIVYEEVVYRGMLWMFLKNLNWSEPKIFFFSSILFWVYHINQLLTTSPLNFWVILPALSLLLGYLIWRSKSLSTSILAHVLINTLKILIANSV
jgi:membrane protease YdiL (CAAX protease family)